MSEQICVWPQKMLFFWLDTSLSMLLMLPRGYRGSQVHGDFVRAFPFFCDIIATFLIIRINMLHWIEFFFLENLLLWRASLSFEGKYCSHWITSGINWTCDFHKAYQYSCLPHLLLKEFFPRVLLNLTVHSSRETTFILNIKVLLV